jgi:cytochrome c oxidase cbb3-type subunit III
VTLVGSRTQDHALMSVVSVLTLALGVAGCAFPGRPNPANEEKSPDEVRDFSVLFAKNCSGCHGADGKLGPAPPLNDPLFLAIVSDEILTRVITHGREGTLMPGFGGQHPSDLLSPGKTVLQSGTLTTDQIGILVKGLRQEWGTPGVLTVSLPAYQLTKLKPERANEGRKVFQRACASCHGQDGEGSMAGAINDPDFLALLSNQVLRRLIITGRPELGMPNFADAEGRPKGFRPLSSDEVTDLVALLDSWRK